MPLPSSGALSLSDLVGEFGSSGAVQLSDYYRGGGLVPDIAANSGVPTSGAMSLSDFYGTENGGSDVTPAAVNWADISGAGSGSNANQTISGIDTSIEISWSFSGTGTVSVFGDINDGSGQVSPVTVSNSDTLSFTASSVAGASGTVTVVNNSDGGTTLDTFTVSLSGA